MRNYQLRKANKTYSEEFFFLEKNKCVCVCGGVVWDCIYMYIHICSLGFGVILLIFQN